LKTSGSNSARRRRGKRKSVREVEGDVADCEEEVEHEERERLPAVERCLKTAYRATVQVPSSPITSSSCLASPGLHPASPSFTNILQASPNLSRFFPSSPSMESLRVPGTMVMDSNNAGSRAPTMNRLSLLVAQHVMQCANSKINRKGTSEI